MQNVLKGFHNMKIGDLVRRKFVPGVELAIASTNTSPKDNNINTPGIVIEVAGNACKVVFPSLNGNIRSFLKSSLDVIS